MRSELAEKLEFTGDELVALKAENTRLHEENKRLRIALGLTTHDEYYIKRFNEDELRRRLRHINQLVEKTLEENSERIE